MNSTESILSQIEDTTDWIHDILLDYEQYEEPHSVPWTNSVYRSDTFRRAHIDVMTNKKLYMLHLCVFPNTNDPSPIFGFDLIAGEHKVTGAFHDFSPVKGDTNLDQYFQDITKDLQWTKTRQLPDWAKRIFSPNMIAAGNIQDPAELETLLSIVRKNFLHYLAYVGTNTNNDYTEQQNSYCRNQKHNPHTPRVMKSLGFSDAIVDDFINLCLFPEI